MRNADGAARKRRSKDRRSAQNLQHLRIAHLPPSPEYVRRWNDLRRNAELAKARAQSLREARDASGLAASGNQYLRWMPIFHRVPHIEQNCAQMFS
jgi:hypothetical protein